MPGPGMRWLETTPIVRSPPEAFKVLTDTGSGLAFLAPASASWVNLVLPHVALHGTVCPVLSGNVSDKFFLQWHWPFQSSLCHLCKLEPHGGFPGGSVVKNLPANVGDMGSIPGLGRSHMPQSNEVQVPQLLSPGTATIEPSGSNCWRLHAVEPVHHERSHYTETPTHCNKK